MPVTINGTTGIAGVDGSAGTPAMQGTDTNTGIFFPAADTIAFAEGGAEVARIDSSGNLGIGTSSPSDRLTVISAGTQVGSTNFRRISRIGLATTDASVLIGYDISAGSGILASTNDFPLAFWTSSSGTYAERARIDSSGNLLVGNTNATPAQSNVSGFSYRAGIQLEVGAVNAQAALFGRSNDGQIIRFYNGGAVAGNISNTGTTTSYNGTSDYRLKENIQPMTGALAKVAALKPCTYTWKADGRAGQGFIAHELQEVIPDAVQGEKDQVNEDGTPEYQGIDPRMIVATLTAAIQELKAELDTAKARIAALEAA